MDPEEFIRRQNASREQPTTFAARFPTNYNHFRQSPNVEDRRETSGYMDALLGLLAERSMFNEAKQIYNEGFQAYADDRYEAIKPKYAGELSRAAGIDDIAKVTRPLPFPPDDPVLLKDEAEEMVTGVIDNPMGDYDGR